MNVKWSVIIGIGLTLCQTPAQAATLESPNQLPVPIQNCLATADCFVAAASDFELGGIAAFRYLTSNFSGYLFHYPLLPPSAAIDVQDAVDYNVNPLAVQQITSNVSLAGRVWLQVSDRYARSEASHPVVLYLDQGTPNQQLILPRNGSIDQYPSVLNFDLSSQALLASHAYRSSALNMQNASVESGDLIAAEALVPCAAAGCSVSQDLNLIGMAFVDVGNELLLRFAPDDIRQRLYAEDTAYSGLYGFHNQRELYVQPIPLPFTWLLWLSGFGMMLTGSKRTKAFTISSPVSRIPRQVPALSAG